MKPIVILTCVFATLLPLTTTTAEESEILYWVAPMDPNFRRDEPGKSPMGMDLVPVYADAAAGDAVSIDPAVVQSLGVRTAEVERGPLWRMIDTVGYVAFDERKLSHLHLRTDGWIESLKVKSDGERVRKGDVLFELYSRELVNAQEEYLQALRGSSDYLKTASKERLQALGMSNGQIAEVKRTRRAAQKVRILASQDGVIHNMNVREGMYVKPDTEVLTLADLASVWVQVDVFERQADWVDIGQPAEVRLGYLPGRLWEGEVEFIRPTIDPMTRTLQARLRFDNPDESLKPEMFANVRIYAGPVKDVLSIPAEALIKTGDEQRVIVALGEGKFRARPVTAGLQSGDFVEVIDGLTEGDKVVTSGQFLIDSEASLRASFSRMESNDTATDSDQPVRGHGTVVSKNAAEQRIGIEHDPIDALEWPAMTMDFMIDDTVDLEAVAVGDEITFELVQGADGGWWIENLATGAEQ